MVLNYPKKSLFIIIIYFDDGKMQKQSKKGQISNENVL